ncbi:MAG: hypothetical protein RLZ12_637 [Bacillota bacterium]|jgi:catechol 2,3-dioxygenase-like lactoylglutathione lyase family enzyme
MITDINHINLSVKDLDISFKFYREVLGFKPIVKWHQGAYFVLESGFWFCLNNEHHDRKPSPCYTHVAFTVKDEDFESIASHIIKSGVTIFKENTSPDKSLYFLDPDGHKLEIHVGNPMRRVQAKKQKIGQWKDVEWFV